jgi:hypothetical protein
MPARADEAALYILRIRTRATPQQLSEALDVPDAEIATVLPELADRGLAKDSGKPRLGWAITPEGKRAAEALMTAISAEAKDLLAAQYEKFSPLNDEFKQLCTDWQTRDPQRSGPADFLPRLAPIDDGIQAILRDITPVANHFAGYESRFAKARAKFEAGTESFLTGVLVDSYHNIWFECHECFFITLGRSRTEEES